MARQDLAWFQGLSTPEVASMVRERGPETVVFAAGGTTRWFILNHLNGWPRDMSYWREYAQQGGERFLSIARMFFDHGVRVLFTHAIVPGQLEGKGKGYMPKALTTGMKRLAGSPEFLRFYTEYGVRARFFGDYRQALEGSEYEEILALFDELEEQTKANDRHLIYWGFSTRKDQSAPILELAIQYYQDHRRVPSREQLVELYYGEPIAPVGVFIGFNRPKDLGLMPPLLGGQSDLYFTVGLSYDFSQQQFRSVLYDHLYARRGQHRDYAQLPQDAFAEMQAFYRLNRQQIVGIGRYYEPGAIWYPLPQVRLPPAWTGENA
jgi:hypothetical protein